MSPCYQPRSATLRLLVNGNQGAQYAPELGKLRSLSLICDLAGPLRSEACKPNSNSDQPGQPALKLAHDAFKRDWRDRGQINPSQLTQAGSNPGQQIELKYPWSATALVRWRKKASQRYWRNWSPDVPWSVNSNPGQMHRVTCPSQAWPARAEFASMTLTIPRLDHTSFMAVYNFSSKNSTPATRRVTTRRAIELQAFRVSLFYPRITA